VLNGGSSCSFTDCNEDEDEDEDGEADI
jgi:hypothetical protein